MRKLSLILALLMILASMMSFVACKGDTSDVRDGADADNVENADGGEKTEAIEPADAILEDMVAAICEKAPYDEFISEMLYKENDPDEMICWTYGVVDINAYDYISDYVITMPSDYSQTLAIIKFNDGMTEEDFAEVKDVITSEYIESRSSALQMYMPEEYNNMEWALENPDSIWRQYGDNMLVLAIYGGEEPAAVWEAIDGYLGN